MASLSSRQAADRLGVNIQKFHRLVRLADLTPVLQVDGKRGAKFWAAEDIEALAVAVELAAYANADTDGDAA